MPFPPVTLRAVEAKKKRIDLSTFGYSLYSLTHTHIHMRRSMHKKSITEWVRERIEEEGRVGGVKGFHAVSVKTIYSREGGKSFKTRWCCKANLPSCFSVSHWMYIMLSRIFKTFFVFSSPYCCWHYYYFYCYIATLNKSHNGSFLGECYCTLRKKKKF